MEQYCQMLAVRKRASLNGHASRRVCDGLLESAAMGARERDTEGRLPLAVAAWHAAPSEVVQALLKANPAAVTDTAEGSAWLPLHIALQARAPAASTLAILEAHPTAAAVSVSYGWMPLHIAARRGASPMVLRALHGAHPAAARTLSESGDTPLESARKSGMLDAARVLREFDATEEDRWHQLERQREKDWWAEQDAEQLRTLEALVSRRDEERKLAKLAVDGGGGAEAAARDAARDVAKVEAIRQLKHQVEVERGERDHMEKMVAYEREETQRLQQELEELKKQVQARPAQPVAVQNPPPQAAGDWQAHTAKSGRTYWYNAKTKESSWTDPNGT